MRIIRFIENSLSYQFTPITHSTNSTRYEMRLNTNNISIISVFAYKYGKKDTSFFVLHSIFRIFAYRENSLIYPIKKPLSNDKETSFSIVTSETAFKCRRNKTETNYHQINVL